MPLQRQAFRQASRAVSRLYDEELRAVGRGLLTQYSLLRVLSRVGQVRQGDLSALTFLDETTLTRNLRPLLDAGWISVHHGDDRREKLVTLTEAGAATLVKAQPAWERAQARMQSLLPKATWSSLMTALPAVARISGGE